MVMKWSIQPYLGRGSGDLTWGGGVVKNTPPLYIDVSTAIAPKMVPNLISRQDLDVSTEK